MHSRQQSLSSRDPSRHSMPAYRPSLCSLLACVMGADGIAAARLARCMQCVGLPHCHRRRHLHVGLFESVETAWLALGACWWCPVSEACTCPFCAVLAWRIVSSPRSRRLRSYHARNSTCISFCSFQCAFIIAYLVTNGHQNLPQVILALSVNSSPIFVAVIISLFKI